MEIAYKKCNLIFNHTSVDIRADGTIRKMQNLSKEIRQSVSEQQSLNRSINAMDMGQNRTDYQQLNHVVSETKQQIQNNTAASNILQAQIGETAEEMAILPDNMKNIYGNNFGESFQDIANSMAQIKQLTGQTDHPNSFIDA